MNMMKEFCRRRSNFKLFSFPAFLLALTLILISCIQKNEVYNIIEFTGNESVLNYSKSLTYVSFKSDSVYPAALLACENDLIFYGDELFIYTKSLGNKFQFDNTKIGGFINGKITTLDLHKRTEVLTWFKQMESTDLSQLQFVKVDSIIPEDYYPYLTRLAQLKPGIGIYYGGDPKILSKLVGLFNPKYLVGETINSGDFKLLSQLSDLEILVVALDDSVNTGPLPAMPALKNLCLTEVNSKVILDDKLLSANKSLERLTIMESARIDLSVLNPLKNLKELVISNFDTILNPGMIKNQKYLEVLSVVSEKSNWKSIPYDLKRIRWMSFSPDISQSAFNLFINSHPDLEVAEIIKNDTIRSLSPLLNLKKLYGLIISDTLTDLASVKSLKNLKYLSLPANVLKDKSSRDELRKLLPDTRIAANEGFCLGSGWLLIILPLVLLFRIADGKKAGKVSSIQGFADKHDI
jgi:hypothetical protein